MHQIAAMRGVLGIFLLLAVAWALGEWRHDDRERRIPWRTVVAGLILQIVLAVLLLRFPECRTTPFSSPFTMPARRCG